MLTADLSLETVAVPQLAIVGESHADPFYGAMVRDPATGKPLATASVTHIPVFKTDEFLDAQQHLHVRVVLALAALRLLLYCAPDKDDAIPVAFVPPNLLSPPWGMAWRPSPFLKGTPLLFVVGEINARQTYQAIPQHADVIVPFPAEALAGVPGFAATAKVHAESLERRSTLSSRRCSRRWSGCTRSGSGRLRCIRSRPAPPTTTCIARSWFTTRER